MRSTSDVTDLLDEWNRGNSHALDELLPLIYAELRRVAARQLRAARAGHTLQPTPLVHEAYIRLTGQRQLEWQSRAHFFGVAAAVMRRILVGPHQAPSGRQTGRRTPADSDRAGVRCRRARRRARARSRSGPWPAGCIDRGLPDIVELRAFGGLTIDEAAHMMNVSQSTAKREWRTAKAWLVRELGLTER